eukprot:tig00000076_g2312.t1
MFLAELLAPGFEAFEYFSLGLPNREGVAVKREAPDFVGAHPEALLPIRRARPPLDLAPAPARARSLAPLPPLLAAAAADHDVTDRIISYVDRATGALSVYEVVRNSSYDIRTRPFYKSAVASGAPIWTPAIRFVFGRSGFSLATPIYNYDVDGGGGRGPRPLGILGAITIGLESAGISHYLASIRVAENGFTAIVAGDTFGTRRAVGWRKPEILTRPAPLVPGQGVSNEWVPTAELPDPELRALLSSLPEDVVKLHDHGMRSANSSASLVPADLQDMYRLGDEHVRKTRPAPPRPAPPRHLNLDRAGPKARPRRHRPVWRAMRRFRAELDRIAFFDLSDPHAPPPEPRAPPFSRMPPPPPPPTGTGPDIDRDRDRDEPAPTVLLSTSSDLPPSLRRPSLPMHMATRDIESAPPIPPPPPPPPPRELGEGSGGSSRRPTSSIKELDQASVPPFVNVGEAFAKMKQAIRHEAAVSGFLAGAGRGGLAVVETEALRVPGAGAARRFPVELVLVVRDISQRKTMELALVESERRARVASEDMKRILETGAPPEA